MSAGERVLILGAGQAAGRAAALRESKRLAVIGGGFLGLEAAASAAKLGLAVVVLEAERHLLDRAMAPAIAEAVLALHRAKGVDVRLGARVSEVGGDGRIE